MQQSQSPPFSLLTLGDPLVKPSSPSRTEDLGPETDCRTEVTGCHAFLPVAFPHLLGLVTDGGQALEGPSLRVQTNGFLKGFSGQGKERKERREREKENF